MEKNDIWRAHFPLILRKKRGRPDVVGRIRKKRGQMGPAPPHSKAWVAKRRLWVGLQGPTVGARQVRRELGVRQVGRPVGGPLDERSVGVLRGVKQASTKSSGYSPLQPNLQPICNPW